MQTKTLSFEKYIVGRGARRLIEVDSASSGVALANGLHVLIAPNGSGKSSLFQTLAGVIPPLGGIASVSSEEFFYASEYLSFPKYIYPPEWIAFKTGMKSLDESAQTWVSRFKLEVPWKNYLGRLSQGERRKIVWIAANLSPARWVLLDEPFHGLDLLAMPVAESMIRNWVQKEGRGCWIIDHQWRSIYGDKDLKPTFWFLKNARLLKARELESIDRGNAQIFLRTVQEHFAG